MRTPLLSLLSLSTLPAAVSALSPFPGAGNITASPNTTVALEHIYSLQETVIPISLWGFILSIGLIFLTISILYPERGELVTGLLGLAFITLAWIQSMFLGTTEIVSTLLANNVVVVQPVTLIYGSHWLPWLLTVPFFTAFFNVILAIANFLKRPTDPYPRPDVMQ